MTRPSIFNKEREADRLAARCLPVVVSFFTNQRYSNCARELEDSLLKLRIDYWIQPRKSRGDHKTNLHQKIPFIREALDKYPDRSILWVDADATFRRWPAKLDLAAYPGGMIPFDCAFARGSIHDRVDMVMGGTLFFANTNGARTILDEWWRQSTKTPKLYDFENLSRALVAVGRHARVLELPLTYCWVGRWFQDQEPHDADPVIEHYAISQA